MAFLLIAPPHLFLVFFFILLSSSTSSDTLLPNHAIRDGETLVSAGKMFVLGFFSPGSSTNRYVGIWYYVDPDQTVVWVANRENPLSNASGILTLVGGDLAISDESTSRVVWLARNATTTTDAVITAIARLTDSGNLVLSNGREGRTLWESFDHPTDTGLPGMKLGFDRITGLERFLSSWKSPGDPAAGEFSLRLDAQGQPEFMLRKGSSRVWRSGPWNGLRWSGTPEMTPGDPMYSHSYVSNENETYFMFNIYNASIPSRLVMNGSGKMQRATWLQEARRWNTFVSFPAHQCDEYGKCGINGGCNTENLCVCLLGFQPRSPQEWYLRDGSDGCERRKALTCGNGSESDGFFKVEHVKLPDTFLATAERGGGLKECHDTCLRNCSCTAYSTADISGGGGGSGCVMWGGDLMDLQVYDDGGQDLYVRVVASELESNSTNKRIIILISTITAAFILFVLFFSFQLIIKRKRKGRRRERQQHFFSQRNEFEETTETSELPLFDLRTILAATDNFSSENKLGEGGFGPVYKGILMNGLEIAVKRLSQKSRQGSVEFKNEVMLMAKLQHRNLVRILGCCIQGEEKMLIYEYMRNKSLDSFIFDETRRALLDWSRRFQIIVGIARGVLYLHQDSRLRVIHRDLKASNVLLDDEMNPKISDFGMARIFGGNETPANTKRVVGTYGYMSPEYAMDGLFSPKSDVFSFGVLLLEIINGKRNNGYFGDDPYQNLIRHAWKLWQEGRGLELVDPIMASSYNIAEIERCIQVGLLCVQENATDRPNMASVVLSLAQDTIMPKPKQPAFYVGERLTSADASASGTGSGSTNYMTTSELHAR